MKNLFCLLVFSALFFSCSNEKPVEIIPNLKETFQIEANSIHYYIVAFPESDFPIDFKSVKKQVADYHKTHFSDLQLRVSNIYLGSIEKKTPMLVIRRFQSDSGAFDYHEKFIEDKNEIFSKNISLESFPISQKNYRGVLNAKNLTGYKQFFQSNYSS